MGFGFNSGFGVYAKQFRGFGPRVQDFEATGLPVDQKSTRNRTSRAQYEAPKP